MKTSLFGLWAFGAILLAFQAAFFASVISTAAENSEESSSSTCHAAGDEIDDTTQCNKQRAGKHKSPLSWIDEMGDKTQQFLREKVFGQKAMEGTKEQKRFLSHLEGESEKAIIGPDENPFFKLLDRIAASASPGENGPDVDASKPTQQNEEREGGDSGLVSLLIEKARTLIQEEQSFDGTELFEMIQKALDEAAKQLQNTFGAILGDIDPSIAVSMIYYMAEEESKKTPTWKRRQHRFFNKVSKDLVLELHDALYLAQLAYAHTLDDFKGGLAKFQNYSWELVFGTTDSTPTMPAHFLLIHKNIAPLKDPVMTSVLPWEKMKDNEIEVTLVVRGTKHLSDIISDALLEPAAYKGGYAHSGILTSGKALAKKYSKTLKQLLKESGRDKVRLNIVGHSLGAGAGAIAAMELQDLDFVRVEAVGFGCPSLLSAELSLSTKEYITTVVADADIIPRISGAASINLFIQLLEFDWLNSFLTDMEFSVERARSAFPFGDLLPMKETVISWTEDYISKEIKPKIGSKKYKRVESLLIPPGDVSCRRIKDIMCGGVSMHLSPPRFDRLSFIV